MNWINKKLVLNQTFKVTREINSIAIMSTSYITFSRDNCSFSQSIIMSQIQNINHLNLMKENMFLFHVILFHVYIKWLFEYLLFISQFSITCTLVLNKTLLVVITYLFTRVIDLIQQTVVSHLDFGKDYAN